MTPPNNRAGKLVAGLCLLACTAPAVGFDWSYGGYLKYQATGAWQERNDLFAALVEKNRFLDQSADVRLKLEARHRAFEFVVHDQLVVVSG
ncbi:MAG: hypothetical protein ABR553_09715, partial [Gammaproteobacteria bacterium]